MRAALFSLVVCILSALSTSAIAQDQVWIQIEAHQNQSEAEARARLYARDLTPIEGYRLSSGWHAITVGPLSANEAQSTLRQLRITRQIPTDSYLVDGRGFRGQFYPPLGARNTSASQASTTAETSDDAAQAEVVTPTPQPDPVDETPAEARRSEALLNKDERMELQSALAWEGFYTSAIDGAIGRGSRNAMAAWQTANGYEATGILTTRQRAELLGGYRALLASIGMTPYVDDVAGIEIELPMATIQPDGYVPPMAHFAPRDGSKADAFLISQTGDRVTLGALYEVLQTLSIVPLDGPRKLNRNSFDIEGRDAEHIVTIHAEVSGDDIKGYALSWPTGDEERRNLVWSRMRASFTPVPGTVLSDTYGNAFQSSEALAGLSIRRPERSQSGFFVSNSGAIVTAADNLEACSRITIGTDDTDAQLDAKDAELGLALLAPKDSARPVSVARFSETDPNPGSEIAVAGFSYGGKLSAPSLAYGTLTELTGLNDEPDLRRLQINAAPGDAGGPVMDASAGVLGVLKPVQKSGRVLPEGVHFAISGKRVSQFLLDHGVSPQGLEEQASYRADELAMRSADFTVLVNCWN